MNKNNLEIKDEIRSSILLTKEENQALKVIAYQDERSLRYVLQKAVKEFIENHRDHGIGQS